MVGNTSHLSIVKNPLKFRATFLNSVNIGPSDESYISIIHIFLYYVWRGAYKATTEILQGRAQPELSLICLSCYKAFLPIIQLIRLGYSGDALILLRALMERIAILDYLNENPELIQKYKNGKTDLNKDAMPWAKKHAPHNWMHLYSYLSNIAHSKREGIASHIFEENAIGEAFLYMLPHTKENEGMTEESLALICYAIGAIDPIAAKVLKLSEFHFFPVDVSISEYATKKDLLNFQRFLSEMISKYGEIEI